MIAARSGSIIYMGSVHSKLASPLKAPYVTAKHGLIGLAKVVAKEGARHGVRANVICPGFVRTPLVDKQIPEQAKTLGISEAEVIKKVMLKETVDGEFTTVQDVAQTAVFLAAFPTHALPTQLSPSFGAFGGNRHLHMSGDFAVQLHRNMEFAEALEWIVEMNLTAIDIKSLTFERRCDV